MPRALVRPLEQSSTINLRGSVDLILRGPLTEDVARVLLQRAWYVAIGSATVMLLGALFSVSFNLLLGGVIVIGLGHGMVQRSWIAAGALLFYLVAVLTQAGWRQGQPILILLAAVVAYFLAQGFRATWWWRQGGGITSTPVA
jgi:hypothetical protein